jgi:hypothetical protein
VAAVLTRTLLPPAADAAAQTGQPYGTLNAKIESITIDCCLLDFLSKLWASDGPEHSGVGAVGLQRSAPSSKLAHCSQCDIFSTFILELVPTGMDHTLETILRAAPNEQHSDKAVRLPVVSKNMEAPVTRCSRQNKY